VNRSDCAVLLSQPFFMRLLTGLRRPRRDDLGSDFAGEVEAVGPAATRFRVGDRVWGFNDMGLGSHAECLVIGETEAVAPMPNGVEFEDAAASIEGAFYAYNFLNKVEVDETSRVLVNGATGAIGSALLQLCKNAGATVTAVGNTANLELLRSLGADAVIDYETTDFTRCGQTFDFVFDSVGKSRFGRCRPVLARRGVYISSELGPGWQNPFLALVTPMLGGRRVAFPVPTDIRGFLALMKGWLEAGRFRPVIDRRYTLDGIREAFAYVAAGRKTGNVVLKPNGQGAGSHRPEKRRSVPVVATRQASAPASLGRPESGPVQSGQAGRRPQLP
jgi:NADPH:quinone reductase-like Zn-dependent oxidoreductase